MPSPSHASGSHDDAPPLAAGAFAAWLAAAERSVRGAEADVPCHGCVACCSSSQFVLVEADESATRAVIPAALLFPAPRSPGDLLLGYDEHGRCPMLVDGRCSIYPVRPRACRAYDCRVLAAAGADVAAEGKPAVAARVARWRFDVDTPEDRRRAAAVRAAAAFLTDPAVALPDDVRPPTATATAVVAVRVHDLFLDGARPPLAHVVAAVVSTRPGR